METPPPRFRGFLSTGDAIALVGVVITLTFAYSQSESNKAASLLQHRQASTKIAVGILSEKSRVDKEGNLEEFTEGEQALRWWAVEQLKEYSLQGAQLPPAAQTALIEGGARITSGYSTYDYGSTYDEPSPPKNPDPAPSPTPDAPSSER